MFSIFGFTELFDNIEDFSVKGKGKNKRRLLHKSKPKIKKLSESKVHASQNALCDTCSNNHRKYSSPHRQYRKYYSKYYYNYPGSWFPFYYPSDFDYYYPPPYYNYEYPPQNYVSTIPFVEPLQNVQQEEIINNTTDYMPILLILLCVLIILLMMIIIFKK